MAPEQAQGDMALVDRRSDVYGLGALLFAALTARAPFQGVTPMNVLHQVLTADPPRPSSLRADVDRDLDTVVLTCLEKDPARRYPSAEALADDLERWLAGQPIAARRPGLIDRALRVAQ